jgi:surfeit locus 1 family protein
VTLAVAGVVATCIGLGVWQLGRWEQKKARNAATRAVLEQPPVALDTLAGEALAGRRVSVTGRYDESRQILLRLRPHDGETGVEVVTPLLRDRGPAVLVLRGWLPSLDGAYARVQDHPEPGVHAVTGVLDPIERGRTVAPMRIIAGADSVRIVSAAALALDGLAPHFPYPLAPVLVRELPGPGVPAQPLRRAPKPLDEGVHLGYAIQWFAIAAIVAGGSIALARSRRTTSPTSTSGNRTT